MKVIMMNGGLGNQLFQYIFYKFIQINSGDDCCIDDRFFSTTKAHNGYELERVFGLTPPMLRDRFEPGEWHKILAESASSVNIIDSLASRGMKLLPLSEGEVFNADHAAFETKYKGPIYSLPMNQYVKDAGTLEGDIYYYGYWINMHYFQNVCEEIIRDLTFPPFAPDDDYNPRMLERIQGCHSVSLHVRRGDFVTLGWALDTSWYIQNLAAIRIFVRNPVYFVFSDDIAWCKENAISLGFNDADEVVWMEGNTGMDSFRDMQLMSHCKNMLIANSAFSYLAALLNQTPNKYVLTPTEGREIL